MVTKVRFKSFLLRIPSVVLLFIAIGVFFSITSPYFLSLMNLKIIMLQCSALAIIAMGMSFVMLTNGIDLSVGSVIALVGVVTAIILKSGLNIVFSIFLGILVGCTVGLFNGFIISKIKLPPFVATLGSMGIVYSLALIICGSYTVHWEKSWFNSIALWHLLGIPVTFWITIFIFGVVLWIVHRSSFGIYIYGIGSNEEALRLCGVRINLYKIRVYIMSGFFAGISGIILASRIASGNPNTGFGYEFNAIAAAAIAGISFFGGKGHPGYSLLAAITVTMLMNGLGLVGYSVYWQYCAVGLILIIGMSLNKLSEKLLCKK